MNLDFSFEEGYSRDQMKNISAQIFTADKSGALTQRLRGTTGQILCHIKGHVITTKIGEPIRTAYW